MESYRAKFEGTCDQIRASYPENWQTPKIMDARFSAAKAYNVYSQFGEDGLLAYIFAQIGVKYHTCFEAGATDGVFFSNTKSLRDQGWKAVLIEANDNDAHELRKLQTDKVQCINARLSAPLGFDFFCYEQQSGCDLGVIDVDGADAILWERMVKVRPRVLVIECAEQWGTLESSTQTPLNKLVTIGLEKKYTLVALTHCNAIFVANEELPKASPPPAKTHDIKIIALMSCPRYGPTVTAGCIEEVLASYSIRCRKRWGAYWEQTFQNLLEDLIEQGYDDVITMDYDSVFSHEQFTYMLKKWIDNPQIDALSCAQPMRDTGIAMFSLPESAKTENGAITFKTAIVPNVQARTAHFGLTFLRLSKIAKLPKPWFWSQPCPKGTWRGEGKIDADIYFWRQWEKNGNNLFVLPEIRLGHLEELVAQLDAKTGECVHRYAPDVSNDPFGNKIVYVQKKEVPTEKDKCNLTS